MRYGNGAILSPDRLYRYVFWRCIAHDIPKRCVFIMLNPSTADERINDPTVRKCIGFAQRWEFGYVDVVNLFAWRATKPQGLLETTNPEGRENERYVTEAVYYASRVVLAWGSHAGHSAQLRDLILKTHLKPQWEIIRSLAKAGTLGQNADSTPKHPLMLAYSTPFVPVGAHT